MRCFRYLRLEYPLACGHIRWRREGLPGNEMWQCKKCGCRLHTTGENPGLDVFFSLIGSYGRAVLWWLFVAYLLAIGCGIIVIAACSLLNVR
jgi:hypothetical protein